MQYLPQNISIILMMSLVQDVHSVELIMPPIRLHSAETRKHLSPICLRWDVAMNKHAMGYAIISDRLSMICSRKMLILNLSMAEFGPM